MPFRRLPYRGEPEPSYPKRPKRFRNPVAEKWEAIRTVALIASLAILIGLSYIYWVGGLTNGMRWSVFIFIIVFGLFLTVSMVDAFSSVDKFRPHYDIDLSYGENINRLLNDLSEGHHEDKRHESHSHLDDQELPGDN